MPNDQIVLRCYLPLSYETRFGIEKVCACLVYIILLLNITSHLDCLILFFS